MKKTVEGVEFHVLSPSHYRWGEGKVQVDVAYRTYPYTGWYLFWRGSRAHYLAYDTPGACVLAAKEVGLLPTECHRPNPVHTSS